MKPEIIITEDGSHTLYHREFDEHFHSRFGALTESGHVFIEYGLKAVAGPKTNILELGFGTGLNALLTLAWTRDRGIAVEYKGIEKYPLDNGIISTLNYGSILGKETGRCFRLIHDAPWGKAWPVYPAFMLEKIQGDMRNLDDLDRYDLVYFDAFAPDKQPELWSADVFRKIFRSMKRGAILTTYSSKGLVRRNMAEAGFRVEKLPGPPGKREMTRACKG